MKVTFLSPTLNMGGGTKVIAIYAEHLVKVGHEVLVVSLPCERPRLKTRIKNMFKGKFFYPKTQKSHFDSTSIKQHVIDSCRPIVNGDLPDADIVIATWWETAEWLIKVLPSKGKKVYFIQGHEIFDYIPRERAVQTYKSKLHKIVVSNWLKEIIVNEYGANEVDVVLNGVERMNFYFVERNKQVKPTVGFLISDSTAKGVDVAIKVIQELKKKFPELKVLTFGVSKLASIPFDSLRIDFQLLPTESTIREIYSSCDVWLAPSRSEGFNLTALEAMTCGTPIVATKTGWPVEAVKSYQNGVLVDVDDVEGLVNGVKWILEQSNEEWIAISKNAAMTTIDYSWDNSALQFEQVLLAQLNTVN